MGKRKGEEKERFFLNCDPSSFFFIDFLFLLLLTNSSLSLLTINLLARREGGKRHVKVVKASFLMRKLSLEGRKNFKGLCARTLRFPVKQRERVSKN